MERAVLFFISPDTARKWEALFKAGERDAVTHYTFPVVHQNPGRASDRRAGWVKIVLAPGEALVLTMMEEGEL